EASTYQCKLEVDGAPQSLAPCTSPVDYSSLADGSYRFTAVATDTAGNEQATPTTFDFTVVRGVNLTGGVLGYSAGAADDVITVRQTTDSGGTPVLLVKNTGVDRVPAGAGCAQLSDIEVTCPVAGTTSIDI